MHDAASIMVRQTRLQERMATQLCLAPTQDSAAVEAIVRAVFSTLHGDLSAPETSVLAEIESLARTIAAAKAEIAALRVDDITDSHIPSATDELDAIVAHTAAATDCILEVCEALDLFSSELEGKQALQMADATTRIYEACSFQDITGQRISKVVFTLKVIDEKVAQILSTFGGGTFHGGPAAGAPLMRSLEPLAANDPVLLNGPQLPLVAMGQSDIDKLLASFE